MWPVVDDHVAGQVHHGDHHGEAGEGAEQRGRGRRGGGGARRSGAAGCRRRRRCRAARASRSGRDGRRARARGRRATRPAATSQGTTSACGVELPAGEERAEDGRARGSRRRRRRRARARCRGRGARAGTCRRGGAREQRDPNRAPDGDEARARAAGPTSMPQASAVSRQPATPRPKPPASTGTRPKRSISLPAGSALSRAGDEEDRRPEAENPLHSGHEHERRRRDGDPELEHARERRERRSRAAMCCARPGTRSREQSSQAHAKSWAPPRLGWRTYGAPSAASARRPTAITRRLRASSRAKGRPPAISSLRGGRFELSVPGCVGTTFQSRTLVLEPELGEDAVDDRRAGLGRAGAGQLALGRERDPGDSRAAIARGLADEQERRVAASSRGRRGAARDACAAPSPSR